VEFYRGLVNALDLAHDSAMGSERMNSNVVPISRARSVARRAPARIRPRPLAGHKTVVSAQPAAAVTSLHNTPIWFSVLALIAMTMWPSALVWTVQVASRVVNW
jgi:hypothetical protein